jgi:hypothetical protein
MFSRCTVNIHDLRCLRRGDFVKAKAWLLLILFACAPTVCLFGQVTCSTSNKLICEFPVSAEVLGANTIGEPFVSSVQQIAGPINASIAAQLTQLPIPSATVGTVYLQQKGSDVPVAFENLGPILTDRPDTVGKGHIFIGFSYQHFNFNAFDGHSLGSLPVGFTVTQASPFNASDIQTFYGAESNNVGFKLDQYVGVLTYGLTKTTDVSVIVPFNSVTLGVTSSGFQAYVYDAVKGTYTNLSPAATTITTSGSAGGVGDVILNFKQLLIGGEHSRAAITAGATLRIPTGDALNYLGSGAIGGSAYGLFEYRRRLAPHLKLSYQWNGNSQVMNLQLAPYLRLPGGLEYAAGADLKVVRSLTLALDILGNQFVNAPSYVLGPPSNPPPTPVSGTGIPSTFSVVTTPNNTYTTVNFSSGLKWSPGRHFLFYGNMLMQVNNVGLRSNIVPLAGIAYNFKASR